eukprot:CAMPEP_0201682652 /NCGR_PEP_ID=MMETSP0494-20130426/51725_1 /ASSEMBLY_ACC=CAM_ASM_000839 /TAXON_ID=420259 /ORGANISM="Thalassiosira gravida, Strain GMp14c1" /LENGTH=692 /DNA_ID=CAMNT_0048166411 /DNA_START=30 /DNA_END=2104 /DNA_ORIENTATION=-
MLDSAITLDESNVRVLPMSKDDDATEGSGGTNVDVNATPDDDIVQDDEDSAHEMEVEKEGDPKGGLNKFVKSPKAFILLTSLLLSSIALGVAIGSKDAAVSSTDETCVVENFQERYNRARSIVSNITSDDTLANATSPQNRALEWLVCHDRISSSLIDRAAGSSSSSGSGLPSLPTQAHGFVVGGDSGESQVLRRYALAVFFYSTSESGPWTDQWNFLSGEKHECAWHTNKTRANFPYGEFDPAGVVCMDRINFQEPRSIILNDGEVEVGHMGLNIRFPNNLTGTIPTEFGHIQGMTGIDLQYQKGLYGPIPSTIGNLVGLEGISILFAGPGFGGVIPSSLFTIPTLEWITLQYNEGIFSFPPSINSHGNLSLLGLFVKSSGLSGTIPSFLSEFSSITQLSLEDSSLEGTIPDSLGAPPSINSQGSHSLLGINILSSGLSGTIPSFLSEFSSITQLSLEDSSLEGTIPDSFGALTSLNFFNLRDNSLSGTLPESLGRLPELTAIVLGKNKLTGRLPSGWGNLTKLRLLDLSYNDLTGEIPPAFSELRSLEHISLQHNADLHGPISAFESLGNMSSLLLYGNNFSSTIPEGLFSNFTGQIFADFGHNNFTGALPETFTQWASDTSYLAIMANNFDDGVVDGVICEEVPTLFADCDSCPCCKTCCDKDSASANCHFDLDFSILTGLVCGAWWFT